MLHSPPHTHCLCMALHDCYKLIYLWSWRRPWRESNSLCLFVFSSSFFLCYCCCYLFMGRRQSSVLSHVCNSYHGSLSCSPSKYVGDVRKSKRKKKGRWMDGLVCNMHMCEHVYINTHTHVCTKRERDGYPRTLSFDMCYVCARTRSIKKVNSTSLAQYLFSFM